MSRRSKHLTVLDEPVTFARFPDAPPRHRTALIKFADYLEAFRDKKGKPLGATTRILYIAMIRAAMVAQKSTTPDAMLAWLKTQIKPRTPHGTANPKRYAVMHFCTCFGRELTPKDLPYIGALPRGGREALSEDELAIYTDHIDRSDMPDDVRAILLLLPSTGLRISEATSLRRSSLTKHGKVWGLTILGKGSKVRWVPMNAFGAEALEVLKGYDASLFTHRVPRTKALDSWLFPSRRHPAKSIDAGTVESWLADLRENYWLPYEGQLAIVTPHVLRHTAATRWLRAGVKLEIVQKLLGHSSILTTMKYLHLTDSDLANALSGS